MFDWRDKDDDETVSIPVELRIKVKELNLKGLIGIRRMKNQYPSLLNHIENQTIPVSPVSQNSGATWHQKHTSQKKQSDTFYAVAMATLLAPVSFCEKPNIPICNLLKWDRGSCLIHKWFPYCLE